MRKTCLCMCVGSPLLQEVFSFVCQINAECVVVCAYLFRPHTCFREKPHPLCWSLLKSSPSQGGHQRCLPTSGRLGCRLVSFCGDPVSLTCHIPNPAGCTVCVPCCPLYTTFCAEAIRFYAPVTQLYVSPCLMCHFPLLSHV